MADSIIPQATPSQPKPSLIDLINVIAEKVDPIIKLVSTMADRYQKGQEREVRFETRMSLVAVSVVVLIVGVAGWLTYVGKIDGSTFAFLLGVIVGYVLTFIRDQLTLSE
jgi:hypothetical protein